MNPVSDPRSTCWCCRSAKLKRIFFCFIYWMDKFVRRGLGKVLVVVVYGLVSFVFLMALGIVLPYESLWMPLPLIWLVIPLAFYFIINIIYNYHMASSTPSGRPPKSTREPLCWKCHNHKDINTHHCSMCDECVVNMDHHCIWINRCVGAGNHRYFIQFTGFLAIACLLYCTVGFSTFYYNYWHPNSDTVLCHQKLEESFFWISKLCSYGDEAIGASIFFGFCLCLIIFCLVGGLFIWNILLVSSGSTYIGLLKGQNNDWTWKEFFCPWLKSDFYYIWKDFLNLHQSRTFWRHIALPSSHRPMIPLDWGDKTGPDSQRLLDV